MAGTLDGLDADRFSKAAVSTSGAQPDHRPAGRRPQPSPIACEPHPIARRRFSDYGPKRPAERAQTAEAHVEADVRNRKLGFPQELHGSLYATALKVPVWGLGDGFAELE